MARRGEGSGRGFIQSTVTEGPRSIISFSFQVLIIFSFFVLGYATGYPLMIVSVIGVWVLNMLNVLALLVGGVPAPDFLFVAAEDLTKGAIGAILNALFGYHILTRKGGIKKGISNFANNLFWVPISWVFLSLVFITVYTGYFPIVGPTGIGLCGTVQTVNGMVGTPVSCDPYELQFQSQKLSGQIESNSMFAKAFSPFEIETDLGRAFKSEDIDDTFLVNDGAGALLGSLEPLKDSFTSYDGIAEEITMLADLEASTLFLDSEKVSEVEVTINPRIEASQCDCIGKVRCIPIVEESFDSFSTFLGREYDSSNLNDWCSEPWSCNIPGAQKVGENKFMVGSGYNQQIKCTRPGLALDNSKLYDPRTKAYRYGNLGRPFVVDFDFSYVTEAISTKQLFLVDRVVAETQEEPLSYLGISEESIKSKSITDKRIDFALGVDQSKDFIIPSYHEDISPNIIFLGVTINNPISKGKISDIRELKVSIYPVDDSIKFICGQPDLSKINDKWVLANECQKDGENGNFVYKGVVDDHHEFVINPSRSVDEIEAGDREKYFLSFFVDEDVLKGSLYQGMYIKSEIVYEYTVTEEVDIRVSPDPFS